jgi:hypothetical protein
MKQVIMGPVSITLSADESHAYLLVQELAGSKAEHYSQEIMPGDGPYNTRWAMEMVLRRFVARTFDRWIVTNPHARERKELDISFDDDIIE